MKTSIRKTESMFGFPDNHRISSRLHVFFGPTNCSPPLCGRTRRLVHRCTKHNQQPQRPTAMCFFLLADETDPRTRKRRDGQPTTKNIPDLLMAEIRQTTWDGAETLVNNGINMDKLPTSTG